MFYYVVASDLDGTLLTPNNQLTSFTKKILRLLRTLKVHFIFATGRHYNNVIMIRNNLDIYSYVITENGSRIYNPEGKLIVSYNLDEEIIHDLLYIVHDDPEIIINIFKENEWLINRYRYDQELFLKNWNFNYTLYHKDKILYNNINKIYFTSNNHQKLLLLEKELNIRWGCRINISFSAFTCLEVVSGGISKGDALHYVANLLNYELKDCISFGDSMNDREMLSMAGKGCIMYNAQQCLKDALPYLEIIGSNKNEAVPYYLKYMYFY